MSRSPQRLRKGASVVATAALIGAGAFATQSAAAAEPRVDNPFVGATQYVNPFWSEAVVDAAAEVDDSALASDMLAVSTQPTSVWMDRISAIAGNADGPGLKFHLDEALAQKEPGVPMVFNLVVYDLPGRDCFALASNGELPATPAGMERYKTEYVDEIVDLLDQPEYEDLRIVATIEPDSLPNMVTNSNHQPCQVAAPYYREGIAYTLDALHDVGNVYSYLDAAHAGWLGWDNNAQGSAQEFAEVVESTDAGWDSIAGFVTNTANSTPLDEPFITSDVSLGNLPIRSADFYEWNPDFDELDWTAHLYDLMVAQGAPADIGMLIDTSRNGWGGPDRPTVASSSTDISTYVEESRVDRRTHRGAWCNPAGAGLGERPTVAPEGYDESHLDAFVWVKPPGESDGSSEEIPNDEGKSLDRMCDPTYSGPQVGGNLTGALPGAPLSGKWFQAQFEMLVANAYPAIGDEGPVDPDTEAPTAPTGLTAGATTATSVALSWDASSDDTAVTGYEVLVDGTVAATSSSTSTTLTGLSADTSYEVAVRARDAAGNRSSASTAVTVTTDEAASGTDTTAPTVPGGLGASDVTASAATLSWSASSDDTGVAGYEVLRDGAVVATVTTTSYTDTGLSADTAYSYAVRASDAAGNTSAASAAVSVTTDAAPPAGACTVSYAAPNAWNDGLTANVTVTNTSGSAVSGWEVGFTLPAGQTISNGWSGQFTTSGSDVTVGAMPWNGTLPAGGSVSFGYNASHGGSPTAPTGWTLNGNECTTL
ncbi:glycoside hydrolase family 6 protein [Paraoerskovia marina]|uniref:glycoside hydrolase family 6 protein n=1 Tax=Paraoerskovia marina TaxID=545619 RepID=UPI000492B549|nr:glycoside hydrolase family 6 protein [Paraoerskovia marina]